MARSRLGAHGPHLMHEVCAYACTCACACTTYTYMRRPSPYARARRLTGKAYRAQHRTAQRWRRRCAPSRRGRERRRWHPPPVQSTRARRSAHQLRHRAATCATAGACMDDDGGCVGTGATDVHVHACSHRLCRRLPLIHTIVIHTFLARPCRGALSSHAETRGRCVR